jgi:hypothetical protein
MEPVPKLVNYALRRMVLGQALAVFQAFSLAKLRNLRLLSQKLKFWESLHGDFYFFFFAFSLNQAGIQVKMKVAEVKSIKNS